MKKRKGSNNQNHFLSVLILSNTNKMTVTVSEQYYRGHPQQNMINDTILGMIVEDVILGDIVEKPGFRNLMHLIEPKYTMVSRQHLQYTYTNTSIMSIMLIGKYKIGSQTRKLV